MLASTRNTGKDQSTGRVGAIYGKIVEEKLRGRQIIAYMDALRQWLDSLAMPNVAFVPRAKHIEGWSRLVIYESNRSFYHVN